MEMSLDQKKALAMASARARASGSMTKMGTKDVPDMPPAQGKSGQSDAILAEKVEGGLEAGLSMVSGATTGVLGRAGATLGGLAAQIAQGELGSPEGAARAAQGAEEGAHKLTYTPPGAKGKEYLESAGRALDATKIAGMGPGEAIALAGTPKGASASARAAVAPEVDAIKRVPGKVADIVTPKPSPEIAALAKKAEDMGIELRPDMLSNNKIAKVIGEALEQVPGSGSKAEQRKLAFNVALTKIIGGDPKAKRLTPDVFDRAMTASGEKIGEISRETPITVTPEVRNTFNQRVLEASKFETQDVAKIVRNYVQELDGLAENGIIPGEAFRKINSKIGRQIRSTNNGDLKHALGELQEEMHSVLEANIKSPKRLEELKDARYRYAMAKIIEPMVAKSVGGDMSPAALMNAVTSDSAKKSMMARGRGGEIGDLARIGQAFLKEPASSGTAERGLGYSLLGNLASDLKVAAMWAPANIYNRAGPALTKRAIDMRNVDPQSQQPWNLGIP